MNQVVLVGIAPSEPYDNRVKLILKVTYNGEVFDWVARMPPSSSSSFQDFVDSHASDILADVAAKLQQWEDLNPKTREVVDDTGASITVDIDRSEIVVPTYPDYYVLRAREYPRIEEQLDALWKGGVAQEQMSSLINSVKAKYPKV